MSSLRDDVISGGWCDIISSSLASTTGTSSYSVYLRQLLHWFRIWNVFYVMICIVLHGMVWYGIARYGMHYNLCGVVCIVGYMR